jgi:hypothetical protein
MNGESFLRLQMDRVIPAPRPLAETASSVVSKSLLNLLRAIHNERAMLRDGLPYRSTLHHKRIAEAALTMDASLLEARTMPVPLSILRPSMLDSCVQSS